MKNPRHGARASRFLPESESLPPVAPVMMTSMSVAERHMNAEARARRVVNGRGRADGRAVNHHGRRLNDHRRGRIIINWLLDYYRLLHNHGLRVLNHHRLDRRGLVNDRRGLVHHHRLLDYDRRRSNVNGRRSVNHHGAWFESLCQKQARSHARHYLSGRGPFPVACVSGCRAAAENRDCRRQCKSWFHIFLLLAWTD